MKFNLYKYLTLIKFDNPGLVLNPLYMINLISPLILLLHN